MNREMIAAYIVANPELFQKSRRMKISDYKVEAVFFSCHWVAACFAVIIECHKVDLVKLVQ